MKKILLFLAIGTFSLNSFAQYESLLSDTTRQWNIYNSHSWHYTEEKIDSFYLGLTINYNTNVYREIYFNTQGQHYTMGYLREDTTIGKLWLLRDTLGNTGDALVYDLSVQVGDTFNYNFIVDTIYHKQGKKNIKLRLINFLQYRVGFFTHQHMVYYDTLVFMEGIGTSRGFQIIPGLTFHPFYSSSSDYLICAYKDSIPIYNPVLPSALYPIVNCDSLTIGVFTGIEEVENSRLLISPNPASGIINIESSQKIEFVEIYDLSGSRYNFKYASRYNAAEAASLDVHSKSLDLTNLNSGIYILKLYLKNGEVYSKKIIKD